LFGVSGGLGCGGCAGNRSGVSDGHGGWGWDARRYVWIVVEMETGVCMCAPSGRNWPDEVSIWVSEQEEIGVGIDAGT
jgi:hypothetical protein